MTKTMSIRKGIIGIRSIASENRKGWHIFLDGQYEEYMDHDFKTLVQTHTALGYTLTSATGKGLTFETSK